MAEDFKVKYDGQPNQIDAGTLIHSLIAITAIIDEINKEVAPSEKIEIRVKALESGSFLVHLDMDFSLVSGVLTAALANSKDILDILLNVLKLAKFLKGEPPKSVKEETNGVTISDNTGTITVHNNVYKLYGNSIVKGALKDNFETLEEDTAITGFEIMDNKEKPLVVISRAEFAGIATIREIEPGSRIVSAQGTVTILKIVFEKRRKWEFYYSGNKISAYLEDDEFIKRIDTGESFAKGDGLEVELAIEQTFDEDARTWANKTYSIKRVIQHIPRPKQNNLLEPQ